MSTLHSRCYPFIKEWLTIIGLHWEEVVGIEARPADLIGDHLHPFLQVFAAGLRHSFEDFSRILYYIQDAIVLVHDLHTESLRRRQITNLFLKWDKRKYGALEPRETYVTLMPFLNTLPGAARRAVELWWANFEETYLDIGIAAELGHTIGIPLHLFHALMDAFTHNIDDVGFANRIMMLHDALCSTLVDFATRSSVEQTVRTSKKKEALAALMHCLDNVTPTSLCSLLRVNLERDEATALARPFALLMNIDGDDPWQHILDQVALDPAGFLDDILSFPWFSITEELFWELQPLCADPRFNAGFACTKSSVLSSLVEWTTLQVRIAELEHGWDTIAAAQPEEVVHRHRMLLLARLGRGRLDLPLNRAFARDLAAAVRSFRPMPHAPPRCTSSPLSTWSRRTMTSVADSLGGADTPMRGASPWARPCSARSKHYSRGVSPVLVEEM